MDFFFEPNGVAVVGASAQKVGDNLLRNLVMGYKGPIYPVNPKYLELRGLPCYPTVSDIPEPFDLAIMLVPARFILDSIRGCAERGVKGVIIESAGFAESGEEGRKLQEQCVAVARRAGMRLWGPNCMGMVDLIRNHMFTFMGEEFKQEERLVNKISLVVQSGMLSAGFLIDLMNRRNKGMGKVCSIGNKCDVDECDVMEYLMRDPHTEAIGMYLESISRPRLFVDMARKAGKPLVVLKGGQSASGAQAAMSHTASLAGDARLTNSLLREAGVVQAHDFNQMVDYVLTLANMPALRPRARIAVMTFSGGAGILSCDLAEANGLRVARLGPESIKRLEAIYPPWMPPANPIDLYPASEQVGYSQAYETAFETALLDEGVDLVVMHNFAHLQNLEIDLAQWKKRADEAGKGLAMWGIGRADNYRALNERAQRLGIPLFDELSKLMDSLGEASRRTPPVGGDVVLEPPLPPAGGQTEAMDEYDSKRLLAEKGVPVVAERLAADAAQALAAADEFGYPLVIKGLLPGEVHKTELGLVRVGISSAPELEKAFGQLEAAMQGKGRVLVQPMVKADFELIAGFVRDARFGPCVMLGMGGVLAELRPDITFALAPLDRDSALAMLERLESRKLFSGYRGMAPLDQDAMADLLVGLGSMAMDMPQVEQVDVNPVLVSGDRPLAVDASVIIRK